MSFPNLSLDLRFDEDLMLISSFKAIVSNSVSRTVAPKFAKVNQPTNTLFWNLEIGD